VDKKRDFGQNRVFHRGNFLELLLAKSDDNLRGEFSATLATWFGVSSSDLPTVLPNIGRFAQPNLGIFG
jgi:hypothetical protein